MKPLDEKEKPKLYALIGLAVLVFGYAMYTAFSGTAAPAPAPSPSPGAAGAAGAAGAGGASGGAGGKAGAQNAAAPAGPEPVPMDLNLVRPPTGGRDPFQPVGPAAIASTTQSAPPPRQAPPLPPPTLTRQQEPPRQAKFPKSLGALLRQQGLTPGANTNTIGTGKVDPVSMEAPPTPSVRVTGVVLGDPATGNPRHVAILRGDAGSGMERRFVTVGDYVGNGYSVAAVMADGVELRAGNRRVILKIGQSGDNARAQ